MFILLIEDHHLLAETIIDYLATEDIEADYAARGLQGLELAKTHRYDAIVLDINLPEINGFDLCQTLRSHYSIDTPILMLTARDQLADRLNGFASGADDYLIKPFANQELVARIKALVKRQRGEVTQKKVRIGPLFIDNGSQQVWRGDKTIPLSPTGFRILRILVRESPNVVTRDSLQQELWGSDIPDTDALRSHLYNLRKVLDHPFELPMIHTVKGIGVKLINPE